MHRIRLGIVANEVFHPTVGRMGGFGWAVRQVCDCFRTMPELGVDPVVLVGERFADRAELPARVHDCETIWIGRSLRRWALAVRSSRIDAFLTIDYRPNYRAFFALCPRTPILVWVRDPWDRADRERIGSLRVPGDGTPARGINPHATASLVGVARRSRIVGRRLRLAVTTPALAAKVPDSYGVPANGVRVLPNIVEPRPAGRPRKAARPVVAYLARLDPSKRPWLMEELARRMPETELRVMGQSHFTGPGSWHATESLPNVRYLGHVADRVKRDELDRAWVLLSTSIHEGLSVSFLEALAQETPIVASVDTEQVVSRFGRYVGPVAGDGLDGVGAYEVAVRELLADASERDRLGTAGRRWVEETHSRDSFLHALFELLDDLEVRAE